MHVCPVKIHSAGHREISVADGCWKSVDTNCPYINQSTVMIQTIQTPEICDVL